MVTNVIAFFFIIASAEAGTGMTSVFFFSFFLRMSQSYDGVAWRGSTPVSIENTRFE
jgi:hypothetical protein